MRNHWLQCSWPFKVYIIQEPSVKWMVIAKGPYSAKFNCAGFSDIRDVFGLDSSVELAMIMIHELEHGGQFYGHKRISISDREKKELINMIKFQKNLKG